MDLWLVVIKIFRKHVCICREVGGTSFCSGSWVPVLPLSPSGGLCGTKPHIMLVFLGVPLVPGPAFPAWMIEVTDVLSSLSFAVHVSCQLARNSSKSFQMLTVCLPLGMLK